METALRIYMQKKDSDLENSKLAMKTSHVNKINGIYQVETDSLHKIILKGMEIVKENNLLLRSYEAVDKNLAEKYKVLNRLLNNQRHVKFADEESYAMSSNEVESPDGLAYGNIMNLTDYSQDEVTDSPVQAAKKRGINEDDFDNDLKKSKNSVAPLEDFQFSQPKSVKNLNFGSVHSSDVDSDLGLNTTYDLAATTSFYKPKIILSEMTNKASSTSTSSTASSGSSKGNKNLIQIKLFLIFLVIVVFKQPRPVGAAAKYTLNINKENKKFSPGSNRVKKQTRTPNRVAGNKGKSQSCQRPNRRINL